MTTGLTRKNIFKRDKGRCRICGLPVKSLKESGMAHVVLRAHGGKTVSDNVVTAHEECMRERNPDLPLKVLPIYVRIEDRGW